MTRVVVSLSTALVLSGAGMVVPQIASAVTIAELQASIAALTAQLNALIAQQGGAPAAGKCSFTRDLFQGVSGDDVKCLQQYLNGAGNAKIAASGAGSPGSETTFFGGLTKAAVSKWQAANGVSPTAGYFGSRSRAKYDSLVAAAPPPAPTTTPAPGATPAPASGTGLTVSAATQPGDAIAPLNAARIPATKFTLTAAADGDVVVNSVTVERQGPAADSSVSSIVLLDEDALQIGLSKTLNSNHQAILNEKFRVKAGTSRTITVGLNRPSSGSDGGSIAKLAVVAVDAGSATVGGSLPILGSPITMNSTLTIGTFSLAKGVNDPGASQTKEIGTKGYIFTALRGTPSTEDVSLKWVSWNQSGSASASDLKNVVINAGGTDYPATISDDGKYFTGKFGANGVTIKKGTNFEIYVKGDIESGSNRGVDFDLYRLTDIYVIGSQFGFGLTPTSPDDNDSQTDDDGTFDDDINPVWDAYEGTIGNGTVTVTSSTAIAAQNIAVNLTDQPLGAWDVDIKGEPVTVSSIVIRVSTNRNDSSVSEADYTSVALFDNTTGKVVAGPLDGSGTADTQMVFTFTDAVSFPIGKRVYALKGKLSTDFDTDTLVSASTTPSSDWTSVKGDISGASITPANTGTVSGNSMTVKTGAVTISIASTPTSQTVVRGAKAFTFANIIFDGTNSGEDIRFTSAQILYYAATAGDLTNCQLFDGTTAMNTGSNIVNPSAAGNRTFTLDTNLTIPKGGSKTTALKCDIPSSGTGAHAQWSFGTSAGSGTAAPSAQTFGATGLTSGSSITPSVSSSSATNLMTFSGSGTFTIALEAPPAVRLALAGQEVEVVRLRLTSTNEGIDVKQIALQLSSTASNSPSDLVKLTLWDGATKVGEVTASSSDTGLIVQTTGLSVAKDGDKIVTVKAQLGEIGNNLPGRPGHLVVVDWDSVVMGGNEATYGIGAQSSSNVYVSGSSDTAANGVRLVRAYPTISVLSVPSTSLADATQKSLYRFSVSAPAGTNGVSLYKFTFNVATTGDDSGSSDVTITNLKLYAYTGSGFSGDAYASNPLNQGTTFGQTDNNNDGIVASAKATSTDYAIYFNPSNSSSADAEAIHIPGGTTGQTFYFELKGDVSGADAGDSATVRLMGDNSWYGIGNTSGGTMAYDDLGFLAGAINYGFATTAPKLDTATAGSPGASGRPAADAPGTQGNSNAGGAGNDFIWSGNSTTTHSGAAQDSGADWYNGFQVPGLPSDGATAVTLTL